MKIHSLDNTKRDKKQDYLYDLTYPMLSDKGIYFNTIMGYRVTKDREMRIDLVCLDIYNTTDYIDELMYINGIIDPYSIKEGDVIFWVSSDELSSIRKSYVDNQQDKDDLKINKNKNGVKEELTISTPSDNFVPVLLDRENGQIVITNKLK